MRTLDLTREEEIGALRARYGDCYSCAAEVLCDMHPSNDVAFTFVGPDLSSRDLTFFEAYERSSSFATALAELGVGQGDRVATLMDAASAEFVVALLGIWRRGAVHVPLFTTLPADDIADHLRVSEPKVVVSSARYRARLAHAEHSPSISSWQVVVADRPATNGDLAMQDLLDKSSPFDLRSRSAVLGGGGSLMQVFSPHPKNPLRWFSVPLKALASFHDYLRYSVDHDEDMLRRGGIMEPDQESVYCCVTEPDSIYGLYYGILAPLAGGRRCVLIRSTEDYGSVSRAITRFEVTKIVTTTSYFRALAERLRSDSPRWRTIDVCADSFQDAARRWPDISARGYYGMREHGMFVKNGELHDVWIDPRSDDNGYPVMGWRIDILRTDQEEPVQRGHGRVAIETDSPSFWCEGYHTPDGPVADGFSHDGQWFFTGDVGERGTMANVIFHT